MTTAVLIAITSTAMFIWWLKCIYLILRGRVDEVVEASAKARNQAHALAQKGSVA